MLKVDESDEGPDTMPAISWLLSGFEALKVKVANSSFRIERRCLNLESTLEQVFVSTPNSISFCSISSGKSALSK